MDRKIVRKMIALRDNPAEIGSAPRQVYLGNVAIVGTGNASGFGETLAHAVLNSHPDNHVVLTARGKRLEAVRERIGGRIFDPERTLAYEFDVENPLNTPFLVDSLVVCPAYMNPKYLTKDVNFDDIPHEEIRKSRNITVQGFENAAMCFSYLQQASIWGISFAALNFPGYNIGPIKKQLEQLIINGSKIVVEETSGRGVRQNVLSLGVFDSVAGLGIESFATAGQIYDVLGIKKPSIGEMAYQSVGAIADKRLDRQIVYADGGLGEALKTEEGQEKYRAFISSL